jgi:hypothetical protein
MVVLVISAITLLASGTALAQNAASEASRRGRHWDGYMFMPYTFGQTVQYSGGSSLTLDDDLGWGMGFAYNVDERINIGADFGWSSTDYSAHVEADVGGNPAGGLDFDYGNQADFGGALMTATVHVLPRRLTPFAHGAIGWVWVNSNVVAGAVPGCYWDPFYGYICGYYPATYGDDGVGYRLGAGLRWDAGRAFFLRLGYNHSWIDLGGEAPGFDQIRLDFGGLF